MAFTTENRTVSDIFQRAARYIVPRYQRDYVWTVVNWKELWTDLRFTLDNQGLIPWSHFLGTIVLNHKPNNENGLIVYEIIDGQQSEIDLMNAWLAGKDTATQNPQAPHAKAYAAGKAHHEAMMAAINEPNPDVAFAKAMIPHHQGAVEMAKVQLQFGKDEKMKKLAQDIIKAQEPEIKLMQDWLKQ